MKTYSIKSRVKDKEDEILFDGLSQSEALLKWTELEGLGPNREIRFIVEPEFITSHQLYKYIASRDKIAYSAQKGEDGKNQYLVFIPTYLIEDFHTFIWSEVLDDNGISGILTKDGLIFDMAPVCEAYGIDPESVFI